MKITWLGHSCFLIENNSGETLLTDPFDTSVGYGEPDADADVITVSHHHHDHDNVEAIGRSKAVYDKAGDYSFGSFKIEQIPSFHDDVKGAKRGPNLITVIEADGEKIVHLGDLGHFPDTEQLHSISAADVLLVPIGGYYTIDSKTAADIVQTAKPKSVVAMHYRNERCKFPISDEKEFVKLTDAIYVNNCTEYVNFLPKSCVLRYKNQ